MQAFFNPRSVAVVGVSDKATNLGRAIVKNLHEFAFDGIVYLVGPRGGVEFGRRIYKSVSDIPDQVDLAVILTPAPTVAAILEECGAKGIRRAVIESAGFGEYSAEGAKLEEEVKTVARKHGMRFIGPNGIGVMNFKNGLATPFTRFQDVFRRGGISIVTQSGGVGISYLNLLASENLGISKFVSVGNKTDVDENDLLAYLLEDPDTDIVCMYLESISDGRRLMEIARGARKPILLHKSAIGNLSRDIASSHTAALASDDAVVDAALRQTGIARFRDSETLLNYLKVLPLPRLQGNRLAVVSRSGGQAVLAADACDLAGFTLAPFPESFVAEVEKHFRASVIKLTNPLDLGDLFDYDVYIKIARETLSQKEVDGLVFLHAYVSKTEGAHSRQLFETLSQLPAEFEKPVVTCVATDAEELSYLKQNFQLPLFTDPLAAVTALSLARDFRHDVETGRAQIPELAVDRYAVRAILEKCRQAQRNPLLLESLDILAAYGIPVIPSELVESEDQAVEVAARLGYPVTLKVVSEQISHKSDIGGVQLNLRSADGVRHAYRDMMTRIQEHAPEAKVQSALVQPMAQPGSELIIGGKQDAQFGPVVLVGMGGIFVEIFAEVSRRIAPISRAESLKMIHELRAAPILTGARGMKPKDIEAGADGVVRLARLLIDFPQIAEIDINPFRVFNQGQGAKALDGRIVLDEKTETP
jgi:acetyltransferase